MNTPKELAEFVKERDRVTCAVVEGEPLDTFKAFYRKWRKRGFYQLDLPADSVLEITIRKMAVHETNIPDSTREKAVEWLLIRGYDLKLN